MKNLLAKILFKIGDKLSHYDNRLAAELYVKFMQWSDRLKPCPYVEQNDEIDMIENKVVGEEVVLELPAKLCYSLYSALITSEEFKAEPLEGGVASFWAQNNVIHLYYKGTPTGVE